jgi:hypothetical protein
MYSKEEYTLALKIIQIEIPNQPHEQILQLFYLTTVPQLRDVVEAILLVGIINIYIVLLE